MRRLTLLSLIPALWLVAISATNARDQIVVRVGGAPVPANPAYVPPKADGAVVALLEDDAMELLPLLTNDNSGLVDASREDRQVYSGLSSLRVVPQQRFSMTITGWNFRIVKEPKNAGEFRFVRFAWKKVGGTGIIVQFHSATARTWDNRYVAGQNTVGWISKSVSDKMPTEWTVVTRDLFADFGELTITGIAFSPLDGTHGYFDHVYLGRTIEDLDANSAAVLGLKPPKGAPNEMQMAQFWADLRGNDREKATIAFRGLMASAPDSAAFLAKQLKDARAPNDTDDRAKAAKCLAQLGDESFEVREAATRELIRIGTVVSTDVKALRDGLQTSPEAKYRATFILKKLGSSGDDVHPDIIRGSRAIRVLERAGNAIARDALGELAKGTSGAILAEDAKAALARMNKQ